MAIETPSTKEPKRKKTTRRKKVAKKSGSNETESQAPTAAGAKQVDVGDVTTATPGATAEIAKEAKKTPSRRKRSTRKKKTATTTKAEESTQAQPPQSEAPTQVEPETTASPAETPETASEEPKKRPARRTRKRKTKAATQTDKEAQPDGRDRQDKQTQQPRPTRPQPKRPDRPDRNDRPDQTDRSDRPAQPTDDDREGAGRSTDISQFSGRTAPQTGKKSSRKPTEAREMIVNVSEGFECRVAIQHDGKLEEIFIERTATLSNVGNIYKGVVTNVEPSIQAAFIDFGRDKNGFLHISDVQPQYFPDHSGPGEDVGRKTPRHDRPPIQKCFRRGQEVIVQITKEGVGTKGPTLTSYVSIPGRFLVMMPGMSRHGVSRKIEDEEARRRMRDIMKELELPAGMGCILRTAGLDRTKRDLQRDLTYLQRLWKTVADRVKRLPAPAELYRESDLVTRTIRDVYTSDFTRLVVDHEPTARRAREFLRIAMPRTKSRLELYTDREPLFHKMGIEAELEKINMRHVPLASGGSIVIDSTEALVAIDVNSGRFRSPKDAEETALLINLEAAEEIARQLRLRDLGGLIVCDFIDMRFDRNKRKVETALRDLLKKHKERARTLRMSAFGLIEMTRQRQGPSIKRNTYHDCPGCHGTGLVKMPESVILDAMRAVQIAANHSSVALIRVTLTQDVAFRLLNTKRSVLSTIESETRKRIDIVGDTAFTADQIEIRCQDNRGREIILDTGYTPEAVKPVHPRSRPGHPRR